MRISDWSSDVCSSDLATDILVTDREVTVSCAEGDEGRIYDGLIETEIEEVRWGEMPDIGLKIMMNVGNPQLAFDFSHIPNEGVGLARLEFIINTNINVHPTAVLDYPNVHAEHKQIRRASCRDRGCQYVYNPDG